MSELQELAYQSADEFAIASSMNSPRVLHVANEERDGPICGVKQALASWRMKPKAVYPPGHHKICKRCIKKIVGEDQ